MRVTTARMRIAAACCLALLLRTEPLGAQTTPESMILSKTTWRGEITITRDVTIDGATVRVEAGSTIRFVGGGPGAGPVIRLKGTSLTSGAVRKEARLVFAGTAANRIVVQTSADETANGVSRGAIIADPTTGCSVVARHTIFQRLGRPTDPGGGEPAISLALMSSTNDLWLADCHFEHCGPVQAEFSGSGATAEITRCTFAETVGDTALVMLRPGNGIRVVTHNIADAALRIDCPQTLLRENVLVGEAACIAVYSATAAGIAIVDNYVHCTSPRDEGRYALRCDAPDAVVSGNVLVGGTYVVQSAPRTVTGNVLVGVGGLEAKFDLPDLTVRMREPTSTHYLIANPAAGAVIGDNLLLGPAYAAIGLGRGCSEVRIEHNFFDGWKSARRAIDLNALPTRHTDDPLATVIARNVIARYRAAPVLGGSQPGGSIAEAEHNLFVDVPEVVYEKVPGVTGLADGDRRLGTFGYLRLRSPSATRSAADRDDQLLNRRLTVPEVREMWLSAYRPRPGSPLLSSDSATNVGPRPLRQ